MTRCQFSISFNQLSRLPFANKFLAKHRSMQVQHTHYIPD